MPTEVKGALALRKALKNFTPDLAKALPKEVGDALKPITRTARGYLPDNGQVLSGWLRRENSTSKFPAYNVSLAKWWAGRMRPHIILLGFPELIYCINYN